MSHRHAETALLVILSCTLLSCGSGGTSSSSASSSATTSTTSAPGAPAAGSVTTGDGSATVGFSAPASNGGATITAYTATCTAAGSLVVSGPSSPLIVTGLTNGVAYSCSVTATNSAGTSAPSSTSTVTPAAAATAYNTLWIPPTLEGNTADGVTTYNLSLTASSKQIMSGARTSTYGYNGSDFWGPTLILNKGTQSRMVLQNNLAEATTTHWHGLLVNGAVDGGPHQMVASGATWTTPAFTVKNQAATYWYHPHLHGATQKHLTLGAGGMIIVRDAAETALALPRTYGTDDIPLMLTSRRFTTTNGTVNQFQTADTAYGDYLLANGVRNAEVALPRQIVRLRLLNAEIEREYNLGFGDNRTFYVIGSDGGLLSVPLAVTRLIMAPGERYEILVNLNGDAVGSGLDLKAYNGADSGLSFGFAGLEPATTGNFGSLLNNTTFNLLHIRVVTTTASPITTVPASLVTNTFPTAAEATMSRAINITGGVNGGAFSFNNVLYDYNAINQTVKTGTTESWTVNAGTIFSHSFHIHGVQFKLVARNGSAANIRNYEQGWKDTLYVPIQESVTFVARFDDTADSTLPFMYHCHMSNHEDEGLMGQFVVQ